MRSRPLIPLVLALLSTCVLDADSAASGQVKSARVNPPARSRRVLYNLDGDSCLFTRANSREPVATTVEDVKRLIEEICYKGSRVDTFLVCINAQVVYYPTKVGTMRGARSTLEERAKWPASEHQLLRNFQSFYDSGIDPYAIMLAEAKRRGREAFLTFRMNDAHGNDFLRTQFWEEHPNCRLGNGALDFGREEVRDYTARLIEEAVRRYKCDGLELDFNRFPNFFKDGSTDERVAKMDGLVERVRRTLDRIGRERKKRLILSARVPSNFGRTPPTPETARMLGCDVPGWVRRGWLDFVVVSEFLHERGDLPIGLWKEAIPSVPVYGGIECTKGRVGHNLYPDEYRQAAAKLIESRADGVYLFNFFTSRELGRDAYEPPFEVLKDLGMPMKTDRKWTVGTPIVTYYAGPPMTEQVVRQMADGGFNVVWCGADQLDLVHRFGLRGMVHDALLTPASLDTPAQREKLGQLVDRVRNHPAFYSYYIIDEPAASAFPGLGRLTAYLRQRDPSHMPYINLFPTYATNEQLGTKGDVVAAYREYLHQFVDTVNPLLLSWDNYQFMKGRDGKEYFLNLAMVRRASQEAGIPFLNIVQASSWDPAVRVPVPEEMRYLVYTTAAYGAKGISYYVYNAANHQGGMALADGTPTPLYDAVKPLNREFVAIVSELQSLHSLAVYHTALKEPGCEPMPANTVFQLDTAASTVTERGLLFGKFGKGVRASHVVVVNLDYKSEVIASIVGPARMEVFDAATRKWSRVRGRRAELKLPPGGGKLMRVAR